MGFADRDYARGAAKTRTLPAESTGRGFHVYRRYNPWPRRLIILVLPILIIGGLWLFQPDWCKRTCHSAYNWCENQVARTGWVGPVPAVKKFDALPFSTPADLLAA